MAFATTNIRGGAAFGPFRFYSADYTGSAGDASGTITLNGGRVYQALVLNWDADVPKEYSQTDISVSSGTITVTVHNHMDVTNGTIYIIYA